MHLSMGGLGGVMGSAYYDWRVHSATIALDGTRQWGGGLGGVIGTFVVSAVRTLEIHH